MKLTALRCTAVASLAVLAAGCLPGTTLAEDGPTIVVSGAPPSEWLRDGEYQLSATVTSPVGVWRAGWGLSEKGMSFLCVLTSGECPTAFSATHSLTPAKFPDGVHALGFYAEDRAYRKSSKVFEVRIDRTSPSAPEGLTLVGGDDWRASNRFDVSWTRPKEEQGSPVVGLEYRICPAANGPSDLTRCVEGQQVGSTLEWLDDIAVPRSGIWRLRLALRDEAGNIDLNGGATVTNLRLDADPPEVAFLAADPLDPARVSLAASDAASGVGRVSIEARRDGEDVWRSLKVDGDPGGFSAVLDDNGLPAGLYELRAHAVDKVGNERSAVQQLNGEIVRVQLPVRGGSVLTVGRAKRGRGLDSRPIVHYGKSVALSGRLTDSFGGARAGVEIEITEQLAIAGAQWRPLGIVSTDKNGAFTYRAKAGTARTIRFQYAGTPTTRPAASEVTLRVKAATTLAPSRRSLRNGETVDLRGRLRGGPVPAAGKVVTVQARTQRGWLTFGTARARARDGRWSYRYTFTGTSTTVRYRFRAVVLREEAYPYTTGTSRTVSVLVRGSAR